jgi:DNA polymerase
MDSEPIITELLSLTKATHEQFVYFQELGVEYVDSKLSGSITSTGIPESPGFPQLTTSSALTKEAATFPQITAAAAPQRSSVEKRATAVAPPVSLFGDLGPAPIALAKSSETFEEIWADVGDCTRCPLYQGRTNIVHTEGNRQARLMFVGEAPGADEDAQARPFVGRAGQLLTKIIEAIGFRREEVLIGNVNRCRPPANRPPTAEEAAMCKPFLLREIAAVQPEVIVVLGNTAMRNLLETKQGITRVRGQFQDYHGVKVMPTFHPAYLLRDPSKKKETWEDLKKVRDYLDSTRKREN